MKVPSVVIFSDKLAAGVDALLAALEPADLADLDTAVRRLSGFHALACQLLVPQLANVERQIVYARNEVADTDAALVEANERSDRYKAERDELRAEGEKLQKAASAALFWRHRDGTFVDGFMAQEKLNELAALFPADYPHWPGKLEKAPTVTVTDDPEADLPAVTEAPTAPYPAVPATALAVSGTREGRGIHCAPAAGNAARARENRLAVARALAGGPLRAAQVVSATGIPQGSITSILKGGGAMGCGWWRKADVNSHASPYELTDAGREALREAGFIVGTVVETNAPARNGKPHGPEVESRDRARCKLIAVALAKLVVPLAAVTIAVESGLDMADVEKRLARHGEWFERAGSAAGGDKWKLTAAGRELAAEEEAG